MSKPGQQAVLSNPTAKVIWMLSGGIVSRLASGSATIVLIYFLDAAAYGELAISLFWAFMISVFAGAGLSDLLVKQKFESFSSVPQQLMHAWIIAFGLTLVAASVVYALLIASSFSQAGKALFIYCNAATFFAATALIAQGSLRAEGHTVTVARLIMFTGLWTSVGLVVVAWATSKLSIIGYCYLAGFSSAFAVHLIILNRHNLIQAAPLNPEMLRAMFKSAMPFNTVQFLMLALPVLSGTLVLIYYGEETAGSYNVVLALFLAAGSIATALDQAIYPMFAASAEGHARRAVGYLSLSLFLSLPAVYLFSICGPDLVQFVFPSRYSNLEHFIVPLGIMIPLRFMNRSFSVLLRLDSKQHITIIAYLAGIAALVLASIMGSGDAFGPGQYFYYFICAEIVACCIMCAYVYRLFDGREFLIMARSLIAILAVSTFVTFCSAKAGLTAAVVLLLTALGYLFAAYVCGYFGYARDVLHGHDSRT